MQYNVTFREKDKGWQFIISYKDVTGKWKTKSKQGFPKKSVAKVESEKMVETLKKMNVSEIVDTKMKFTELKFVAINHLKLYRTRNTVEGYEYAFNKFKDLHNMNVEEIKRVNIQNVVDMMIQDKIKPTSIEAYIKKVKQLFVYYKEHYNENYAIPTDNIKLNKTNSTNKKALNKAELENLLDDLKETKYYSILLLCGKCGLRRGEALGITWNDIDEVNSCITVNKQWLKKSDGTWGFGDTKNKKTRIVPVSPQTIKELLKQKMKYPTDIYNRVTPHTGLYISQYLNRFLKPYDITIHELRHTYTTLLIAAGVDMKTVAELIGDNVEQVFKTYSHVNNDMMAKAKNIISNIL